MIQILLPRSSRKFVQIAQHDRVRDVLVADCLFGAQIIRILCTKNLGVEAGKRGERGVRVRNCLRIGVRGQQVQSIAETPLNLGLHGVVGGLTEVLQATIRGDVSILRERTQ